MSINRFACPSCQTVIRSARPLEVGREVKCPRCGNGFTVTNDEQASSSPDGAISEVSGVASPAVEPAEIAAPPAPRPSIPAGPSIAVTCPGCGYCGKVPEKFAGKKIKCPRCAIQFDVGAAAVPSTAEVQPALRAIQKLLPIGGTGVSPVQTGGTPVPPKLFLDGPLAPPPPSPAELFADLVPLQPNEAPPEEIEEAAVVEDTPEPPKKTPPPPDETPLPPKKTARVRFKKKEVKNHRGAAILIGSGVAVVSLVLTGLGAWWLIGFLEPHAPTSSPVAAGKPTRPLPSGLLSSRPGAVQPNFGDWLQDFEQAKATAAKEKKDILVLFDGSDWCGWSIRLAFETLFQPIFKKQVGDKFVLVLIDFPKKEPARSRVQDAGRNARLQRQFGVEGYPTAILTDAWGMPYAQEGYVEGGVPAYLASLLQHQQTRRQRDQLFLSIEKAQGTAKLAAAKETLNFLGERQLVQHYRPLLQSWVELVRQHDPKNTGGYAELFFQVGWHLDLDRLETPEPNAVLQWANGLDGFKNSFPVKDHNRAVRMHLVAAAVLARVNKETEARKYFDAAQVYKPTDRELQQALLNGAAVLGYSSATGFVVAPGGHILTNAHVVAGNGRVQVRLPGRKDPLPAEVLAQDAERDLALIRVPAPEAAKLRPLVISGERTPRRGEKVAALGYPLGEAFGSGLKLTTGVISAIPERGTGQMLVLDVKINPGNSGGPLCDTAGNVVGMVTAKSRGGIGVDSYGMALAGPDLAKFLQQHLKNYEPTAPAEKPLEWDEVDRQVSPSVVMIQTAPKRGPGQQQGMGNRTAAPTLLIGFGNIADMSIFQLSRRFAR